MGLSKFIKQRGTYFMSISWGCSSSTKQERNFGGGQSRCTFDWTWAFGIPDEISPFKLPEEPYDPVGPTNVRVSSCLIYTNGFAIQKVDNHINSVKVSSLIINCTITHNYRYYYFCKQFYRQKDKKEPHMWNFLQSLTASSFRINVFNKFIYKKKSFSSKMGYIYIYRWKYVCL